MAPRAARFALCAALCLVLPVARAAVPLYVIPTESAPGATLGGPGPIELDIYVEDVAGLAALLAVTPSPAAGSDHFRYRAQEYPQIAASVDRSWLESTFVIDHDEPEVRQLFTQWASTGDGAGTRPGVVALVAATVRGSHGRAFDVASMVARRREGDCTEYAVLTAALARRAGLPARVVYGVALLHGPDRATGMGHAWTEILEDGRWVLADAALADHRVPVTYIPYGVMEDEGPGFAGARMRMTSRWIRRIVVVGTGQ